MDIISKLKLWQRKGREKTRHFDSLVKGYDRDLRLRVVGNVALTIKKNGNDQEGREMRW